MTRRFLHNGPWSSLDDAWSGHVPTPLLDTISLRGRPPAWQSPPQAASERATTKRRSERAACYPRAGPLPIYKLVASLDDAEPRDREAFPRMILVKHFHPLP